MLMGSALTTACFPRAQGIANRKLISRSQQVLPKDVGAAMESIAYDSAVTQTGTPQSLARQSRASNRSVFLQRLLLAADIGSAAVGALLAAWIFGTPIGEAGIMAAAVIGSWLAYAFVCGLYSINDLQSWATGLADAPRTVVTALLVSWTVLGIGEIANLSQAIPFALIGTLATVSIDSVARAVSRGVAHKIAPLQQRTVVVGSGVVADRLAERLDRHSEFGLKASGLVDDDVHTVAGTPRLPKLASLARLDEVLEKCRGDRVIIAFSR